jgi:hypothetical protein
MCSKGNAEEEQLEKERKVFSDQLTLLVEVALLLFDRTHQVHSILNTYEV